MHPPVGSFNVMAFAGVAGFLLCAGSILLHPKPFLTATHEADVRLVLAGRIMPLHISNMGGSDPAIFLSEHNLRA